MQGRAGARTTNRKVGERMLAAAVFAAVFALWALAAHASSPRSVYSSVRPADCLLFQKEPLGESRVCPGAAGYNVVLSSFDGRLALELARENWPRNAIAPVTAIAPSFSWVSGTVAEWRLVEDEPVAMILRVGVSAERARSERSSTRLMVLKLDREDVDGACLVGAVPGDAGGNRKARAVADRAQALRCLR